MPVPLRSKDEKKRFDVFRHRFIYDEESDIKIEIEGYYDTEDKSFKIELVPDDRKYIEPSTKEYDVCKRLVEEMIDNNKKWKRLMLGAKTLSEILP